MAKTGGQDRNCFLATSNWSNRSLFSHLKRLQFPNLKVNLDDHGHDPRDETDHVADRRETTPDEAEAKVDHESEEDHPAMDDRDQTNGQEVNENRAGPQRQKSDENEAIHAIIHEDHAVEVDQKNIHVAVVAIHVPDLAHLPLDGQVVHEPDHVEFNKL